ncbi:hypothetical protein ACWGR4_35940 [Embleya sp. NPDC055664]
MNSLTHAFLRVHATLAYPADDPKPNPAPSGGTGTGTNFDYGKFHPDQTAVPKSGVLDTIANGMLWIGFSMAIAALAGGAIMWMVGPIFGSHHVSAQGKTFMWKALGGVAILGASGAICGFVVDTVTK